MTRLGWDVTVVTKPLSPFLLRGPMLCLGDAPTVHNTMDLAFLELHDILSERACLVG